MPSRNKNTAARRQRALSIHAMTPERMVNDQMRKKVVVDGSSAEFLERLNSPNYGLKAVVKKKDQNVSDQGNTPVWKKLFEEFQAKMLAKEKK